MSIGCSYPWPVAARRRQLAATTGGWTGQRRLVSTLLLPSVARRAPQTEMKAPALLEITQGRHTTSGRHPRHTILGVLEVRAEGGPAPAQKALWPLNAFCGRAGRRGKRPRGGIRHYCEGDSTHNFAGSVSLRPCGDADVGGWTPHVPVQEVCDDDLVSLKPAGVHLSACVPHHHKSLLSSPGTSRNLVEGAC